MNRSTRKILWLLPVALALCVTVVVQWRRDQASAPGTLLPLDPASITRIDVAVHGQTVQHYVKRGDHWWRLDPAPVRADDGRLDDMAAIATAPVAQWRQAAELDAAKIGLKPPALVLSLNGHRIAFGALTPFGPARYVRVGDRIAVIGAQYAPRPPKQKPMQL